MNYWIGWFYFLFGVGAAVLYSNLSIESDNIIDVFVIILFWPTVFMHDFWKYVILDIPYIIP